jgi:methyl-accepting chemotaxis protein
MNFINKSLMTKLILLFMAVSLVPVAILGYLSYSSGKAVMRRQFIDSLTTIADSREVAIVLYLKGKEGRALDFSSDGFIRDTLENIHQKTPEAKQLGEELNRHLLENKKPLDTDCQETFVLNLEGKVAASSEKDNVGKDKSGDEYFAEGKKGIFTQLSYRQERKGKGYITISAPLTTKTTKELTGVIVNQYDLNGINEITTNRKGMGDTGEIYIVNKDGYMLTESRFIPNAALNMRVNSEPVRLFQGQGVTMTGIYPDYRGIPVVGVSVCDKLKKESGLDWLVLAEIDDSEAFYPVKLLALRIILIGISIGVAVAVIAYFVARSIAYPVRRLSEQIVKVGNGDLTVAILHDGRRDEVGVMTGMFHTMVSEIQGQVRDIMDAVNVLASSSNQIVATIAQLSAGSEETAVAVTETTSTVEEVKQTVHVASQKVSQVSTLAQNAVLISQNGAKLVYETVDGIGRLREQMEYIAETIVSLSERNQAIGEIIATVDDLAEQSNLLAVNAAIEAAKAGEYGKGFVVVAQEIKSHAEQSKQATKQVRGILNDIQKASTAAVLAAETGSKTVEAAVNQSAGTGDAIKDLYKSIAEASQAVTQIAASSQQQLVGMDQVALAMVNIKHATTQNATSTKQVESTVRSLQDLGKRLKKIVERYKV